MQAAAVVWCVYSGGSAFKSDAGAWYGQILESQKEMDAGFFAVPSTGWDTAAGKERLQSSGGPFDWESTSLSGPSF